MATVEFWLTDALQYSRGHYNPWGRRVIRALDADDFVKLKGVFEKYESLGASVNEQTSMYGYAGHVWCAWMHKFLGDTILHLAFKQNKITCIYGILLLDGVDINIPNEMNETPNDLCLQKFGQNIDDIKLFARKNAYRLLEPNTFDELPNDLSYRSIEEEAWKLMVEGRCLYVDAPKTFDRTNVTKDKKEVFWECRVYKNTKMPFMFHLKDRVWRRLTPAERRMVESHWHSNVDEWGDVCYINEITGHVSYDKPPITKASKKELWMDEEHEMELVDQLNREEVDRKYRARAPLLIEPKPIFDLVSIVEHKRQQHLHKENAKKFGKCVDVERDFVRHGVEVLQSAEYDEWREDRLQEIVTGISSTPAVLGTGDVWGRSVIGDVVRMVRAQGARKRLMDERERLRRCGLALLLGTGEGGRGNDDDNDPTVKPTLKRTNNKVGYFDEVSIQRPPKDTTRLTMSQAKSMRSKINSPERRRREEAHKRQIDHLGISESVVKAAQSSAGAKRLRFVKLDQLEAVALERTKAKASAGAASVALKSRPNTLEPSPDLSKPLPRGPGGVVVRKEEQKQAGTRDTRGPALHPLELPVRHITRLSTRTNMKYMHVGNAGLTALSQALVGDTLIMHICLAGARVSCDGTRELARALPYIRCLTCLDLSQNGVGDEGARALAAALRDLNEIKDERGDIDGRVQSAMLTVVPQVFAHPLKTLSLAANRITQAAAADLIDAVVTDNSRLEFLSLARNRIGSGHAKVFRSRTEEHNQRCAKRLAERLERELEECRRADALHRARRAHTEVGSGPTSFLQQLLHFSSRVASGCITGSSRPSSHSHALLATDDDIDFPSNSVDALVTTAEDVAHLPARLDDDEIEEQDEAETVQSCLAARDLNDGGAESKMPSSDHAEAELHTTAISRPTIPLPSPQLQSQPVLPLRSVRWQDDDDTGVIDVDGDGSRRSYEHEGGDEGNANDDAILKSKQAQESDSGASVGAGGILGEVVEVPGMLQDDISTLAGESAAGGAEHWEMEEHVPGWKHVVL